VKVDDDRRAPAWRDAGMVNTSEELLAVPGGVDVVCLTGDGVLVRLVGADGDRVRSGAVIRSGVVDDDPAKKGGPSVAWSRWAVVES
jgi:hypothetical protein